MKCDFCGNEFSNKQNLNSHQKNTKYCLKIQGIKDVERNNLECEGCSKEFQMIHHYKRHIKSCKEFAVANIKSKRITELEKIVERLSYENSMLKKQLDKTENNYKELSVTAVKRPTNSTKNIQINNYIKNMPPLLESDIKENIQYLTLDHHVKGAEGYAEYALEFPFKNKIVCVDTARNKIKYKNEEGDIIEDVGFRKMMVKLCNELKDRSFNLSQEHYEKLSETFTEKEVDDYNFMETAIAISKFASGKENDFCNKIIKMISNGVTQ
jgi:hypothetical protein